MVETRPLQDEDLNRTIAEAEARGWIQLAANVCLDTPKVVLDNQKGVDKILEACHTYFSLGR